MRMKTTAPPFVAEQPATPNYFFSGFDAPRPSAQNDHDSIGGGRFCPIEKERTTVS
jgi:hypothetical protein